MKIIHIIPSLGNGGAEKLVVDLCNELSKRDEVTILLFREVTSEMYFARGITSKVKLVEFNKKKGFDILFQINLFRYLLKQKPKIIHAHLSSINYLFFPIIFLTQAQVFHTIHSLAYKEEKRIFFRKLRKIYYRLDLIVPISISKLSKQTFNDVYKLNKTHHINNGIEKPKLSKNTERVEAEITKVKKDNNSLVFISVGRLAYAKNFSMLAKAFSKLVHSNIILLIIGADTSNDRKYVGEINKYKAGNTVLLGTKNNVADYLKYADVFCLSSLYEGMPIAVLEAMSVGLPIITTPAGGMIDMIQNKVNGLISDDFSLDSYKKMLEEYLKLGVEEIQSIRQNNMDEFNNNYTIEICAANHRKLYNKFVKR